MAYGDPPYGAVFNDYYGYIASMLGPSDWRHDLSYPLMWETQWHSCPVPSPLWFWDE